MRSDRELAWMIWRGNVAAEECQIRIRDLKLRVVGERYVHVKPIKARVARNFVAYCTGLVSEEWEQAQADSTCTINETSKRLWSFERVSSLIENKTSTGCKTNEFARGQARVSRNINRNVEVCASLR